MLGEFKKHAVLVQNMQRFLRFSNALTAKTLRKQRQFARKNNTEKPCDLRQNAVQDDRNERIETVKWRCISAEIAFSFLFGGAKKC